MFSSRNKKNIYLIIWILFLARDEVFVPEQLKFLTCPQQNGTLFFCWTWHYHSPDFVGGCQPFGPSFQDQGIDALPSALAYNKVKDSSVIHFKSGKKPTSLGKISQYDCK